MEMSRYTKCRTVNTNKRLLVFSAFLLQLRGCHLNHQCGRKCSSDAPTKVVNVNVRHTMPAQFAKKHQFLVCTKCVVQCIFIIIVVSLFYSLCPVTSPKNCNGAGVSQRKCVLSSCSLGILPQKTTGRRGAHETLNHLQCKTTGSLQAFLLKSISCFIYFTPSTNA